MNGGEEGKRFSVQVVFGVQEVQRVQQIRRVQGGTRGTVETGVHIVQRVWGPGGHKDPGVQRYKLCEGYLMYNRYKDTVGKREQGSKGYRNRREPKWSMG